MTRWSVLRMAALGLICSAVSVVVASTYLVNNGHDVPEGIIALGSAAVGALATLMTTGAVPDDMPPMGGIVQTTVEKTITPSDAVE